MKEKKNIFELTRCCQEEYRMMKKLPLALMADNVRSMHNIGSLFRTCDAFLVDELILAGISGCPPHPEITKSALGAEDAVKWIHVDNALEKVKEMQSYGWKVCVLEQAHDSIPLGEFKANESDRYLLVVGNEVNGVDQNIVDIADFLLEIEQWGTKHSLNVSVSGGIALYIVTEAIRRASH